MITNTGLNVVRNFLAGVSPNPPSHIAVGTSANPVAATDTDMGVEVFRGATVSRVSSSTGVVEYILTLESTDANGYSLAEVGVFNEDDDLFLRETHLPFSKTSDFSVKYKIRHTVERGI